MTKIVRALSAGLALQVAMVVFGHFVPQAQQVGLFPIAGTLIGGVTGWLAADAGAATPAAARAEMSLPQITRFRQTQTPKLRVLGAYLGASAFCEIAILLNVSVLLVGYESCCATINSTT